MGTTLVLGVFRESRALVGHIGDSRAYRLRDGALQQITRDHSLLQEQIDAGLITPEQAAFSSHKNLVTRAVGVDPDVQLEVHGHDVLAGDVYLLCSDGLTDMVEPPQIEQLLQAGGPLDQLAQSLVDGGQRGGRTRQHFGDTSAGSGCIRIAGVVATQALSAATRGR